MKLPHTQPHKAANTRSSHGGTVEAASMGFANVTCKEGWRSEGAGDFSVEVVRPIA
jgi:hypothetical protein